LEVEETGRAQQLGGLSRSGGIYADEWSEEDKKRWPVADDEALESLTSVGRRGRKTKRTWLSRKKGSGRVTIGHTENGDE